MILKICFVILKIALITWAIIFITKINEQNNAKYNHNQLTPPKYMLMIGILATALFGFCTFLIVITPTDVNKTATWQMVLLFALATCWGLSWIWSYLVRHHQYDDDGLTYTTIFNQKKFLAWNDIENIDYSNVWRHGILISKTGEKFYIADNVMGLNDFLQKLHDKAPIA